MAILSVKYPIIFTGSGPGFEYTIYDGSDTSGNVIYKGYSYSNEVDISGILQRYMNSDLVDVENVYLSDQSYNFTYELDSVVKKFYVESSSQSSGGIVFDNFEYEVANDYNDNYTTEYEQDYITSVSVTGKYHPDDLVFIDVNSPNKTSVISSNVLTGNLSAFGSAHVTVKQNIDTDNGDGVIFNPIETNLIDYTGSYNSNIAYGNGLYVISRFNDLARSENLTTWSRQNFNSFSLVNDILFVNGTFYAAMYSNNNNDSAILQSVNGSTWTSLYNRVRSNFHAMATDGTSCYFVSYTNDYTYVYWLESGVLQGAPASPTRLNCIAMGDGKIFVTNGNILMYSNTYNPSTLDDWNNVLNPVISANRMYFTNNIFIIVGGNNNIGRISTGDENGFDITRATFAGQINGLAYGNGMYVVVTSLGMVYYSEDLYAATWQFIDVDEQSLYDVEFDGTKFIIVGTPTKIWTIEFEETELNTITVNGIEYPIVYSSGCERYTLYWVNRLGGRSQLLIEGKTRETHTNNFTRFKTNYDRTRPESFENRTILNNEVKSWQLFTGALDDFQSRDMDDLFTSPKVWLHDHDIDRIYSVTIEDRNMRILNRENDHMFVYEINVSQAQDMLRR